jgi:acyl-CoA thioester hydrolase
MEEKNFKHKIKINVRFSDLDVMRHVNNAAYLSYLEEARIAYFNDVLNMPKNSLNFGAIIARIEIDYLQPIVLGDELEVLTRVSKIGNKSSDVEHLIIIKREKESIHAAAALTKLVSYDYKKQQSVPIPVNVKDKIKAFEETLAPSV